MNNNYRIILDVFDASTEDMEWLKRTMLNISALLNGNVKYNGASSVLVIAPLEEDGDEQDTDG